MPCARRQVSGAATWVFRVCAAAAAATSRHAPVQVARLPSVSPYVVVAAVVLVGLLLFVAAMGARALLAPKAPTRA